MSQLLVGCPLCCQATFSSTNALCIALIAVSSKSLKCPLCEEILCGLDKLTIHLLNHLLIQSNDQRPNQINIESIFKLLKQKEHVEKEDILSSEKSKCFEPVTDAFVNIEKQFGFSRDGNINRPTLDNVQTRKIVVDDEVMLVFDKNKKQEEQIQEICLRNSTSSPVSTENQQLKNVVVNDFSHILLLNNIPSDKVDCNSEMYFKTSDGSQNTITELKSDNSDLTIINKRSPLNLEQRISEEDTIFKESNQINFENQNGVLHYSLKMTDNLRDSTLSIDKTKMNFCDVATSTQNHDGLCNAVTHETNINSNSSVGIECGKCSFTFEDLKMLSMHQELVHSNENREDKKKIYSCKLCTKSFKMKGSLVVHTKVAHSAGPTALSKLLEATKTNETQLINNYVTPFTCSVCGKGFKKEQHLVQHEKTHESKQWECDVCGKTFTTKYFLKKHHLLHTGEMPYTCATCNKSFTFQQSYHKHLLYHSDDKPYQCNECGRSFKELSTLHNHQRIHTGEKPYSCETCGLMCLLTVCYLL